MVVVRRDCECKCDGSRQHDSAKDSTEKNTSHIVPFDYFIIEIRLQIGPAFENNLIGSGFAAAWQRGNFKPGDPALWATQNASHSEAATYSGATLRTAKRLQQRLHAIDCYDLAGVRSIFRFRY